MTLKSTLGFILGKEVAVLLIKEVCSITGLSSSTVRYYDSQGLLGKVERRSNNYRIFDNEDIDILVFIKKARNLGFDLDEIKKILMMKKSGVIPCNYVNKRLKEKIAFLSTEIIRLEKEKKNLEKHLSDAQEVCGCRGKVCHYIEGVEEDHVNADLKMPSQNF